MLLRRNSNSRLLYITLNYITFVLTDSTGQNMVVIFSSIIYFHFKIPAANHLFIKSHKINQLKEKNSLRLLHSCTLFLLQITWCLFSFLIPFFLLIRLFWNDLRVEKRRRQDAFLLSQSVFYLFLFVYFDYCFLVSTCLFYLNW